MCSPTWAIPGREPYFLTEVGFLQEIVGDCGDINLISEDRPKNLPSMFCRDAHLNI